MNKEQLISELSQASSSLNYTVVESLAAQALKAFPDETFGYLFLADALLRRENIPYHAVESCLIKLIQLDEHHIEAIFKYAQVKEQQGQFDEAMRAYKNVISKDRTHVAALRAVGAYEFYGLNNAEQALVYLDAAIEAAPLDESLRCLRAEVLKTLKRFGDAVADIDPIISKGFHEQAFTIKVEILDALERPGATLPLLTALVQHQPNVFGYRYHFGKNLLAVSDFLRAAEQIQKAITLVDAPSDELYALLAAALRGQGDYAAAEKAIQQSIALAPNMLSYRVEALQLLCDLQRYEAALTMADALLAAANNELYLPSILAEKALALAASAQWDAAESIYQQLLKTAGSEKEAVYGLGWVAFRKEGNSDKAFFYMHQAELLEHPRAAAFIRDNLSGHLMLKRQHLLEANATHIIENQANGLLQPLFGKLWHFENINSKQLESAPADLVEKVKTQLKKRILFFTAQGALVSTNTGLVVAYTYKIVAEHKEKGIIDIELIPLNGLRPLIVRLQPSSKGLVFVQDAGEYLLFQARAWDALPVDLAAHLRVVLVKEEVAFLGEALAPLYKAI